DPVPPPRQRNPDISEPLQDALLKGLAKDPKDRYRSATELVEALENAIQAPASDLTHPPPVSTAAARTVPASRKATLAIILSAPFVALAVVIILLKTYPAPRTPDAAPGDPNRPVNASREPTAPPRAETPPSPPTPPEPAKTAAPTASAGETASDRSTRSDG